jgi:hypothetical protein
VATGFERGATTYAAASDVLILALGNTAEIEQRDQIADSREQRAESREQIAEPERAGGQGDQGAESIDLEGAESR